MLRPSGTPRFLTEAAQIRPASYPSFVKTMFSSLLHYLFSDIALFFTTFVGILSMIVLTCLYGRTQMHRNQFLIVWLLFLFSCGLACFHIHRLGGKTHEEQKRVFMELVRTSAETLACEKLFLQVRNTDTGLQKIRDLAASWQDTNDDLLAVHLLGRDDERIGIMYFASDAGAVFPSECASLIEGAFRGESVCGKIVLSDRSVSYFVAEPLYSENGGVDSVLCFEIRDWSDLIVRIRTWPHIFFLSFVVFVIATQLFFIRRRLSSNKLQNTRVDGYEKAIESLVSAQELAKRDAVNNNEIFHLINAEIKRPVVAVLEPSHLLHRHLREEKPIDGISYVDSNSIDRVIKGGWKLREAAEDLQWFVDFESNRLRIEKNCFSPERLFHEFRNTCQVSSRESKGMTFLLEISKPIPHRVVGDEKKIRYVLDRFFKWIISDVSEGHVKLICSLTEKELCLKAVDSHHSTLSRTREESDFPANSRSIPKSLEIPEKAYTFGMHVASRLVHLLEGSVAVYVTADRKITHSILIPVDLPEETSTDQSAVLHTLPN